MKKVFGFLFLLVFGSVCAATNFTLPFYSYVPRVYLKGYAGSDISGHGDILAPLLQWPDANFFVYMQGWYGYSKHSWQKNQWSGSLGIGYRQIVANDVLLGAFVLGDYSQATTDHKFKIISPGIELLSRTWDFRANGYIPFGQKDWTLEGWADEFGDYSHVKFTGHKEYDYWFIYHEETGMGADAELGRKLFTIKDVLVKAYAEGYYFHMQHNKDVVGGGGRVTLQPKTYLELSVDYSYDHYNKGVILGGIRVSLYDLLNGASTLLNDQDLHRRLFEPVERDFATLGSGSDLRVTGGPNGNGGHDEIDPITPERNNIWFFDGTNFPSLLLADSKASGLTYEDGTYEHPFTAAEFNQATVDQIDAYTKTHTHLTNADLFFNAGIYTTTTTANGTYTRVELHPDMAMWGRTGGPKGFQDPALGSARDNIQIVGGLKLDSDTSLNYLWVHNDKAATSLFTTTGGVLLNGAQNVLFNTVAVGAGIAPDQAGATLAAGDNDKAYNIGVEMDNNSQVNNIKDSAFYGYSFTPGSQGDGASGVAAVGLNIQNGVQITKIENSDFSGIGSDGNRGATGIKGGNGGDGYGLKASGGNLVIGANGILNSEFLGNGGGGGAGNGNASTGVNGAIGGGGSYYGGNGGNGYGAYIVTTSNNISIGNITGSNFYGNVNAIARSEITRSGGALGGGGAGEYSGSLHAFGGAGGNGYGFYLETSSGQLGALNISDSKFYGNVNLGNISASISSAGGALGGGGIGDGDGVAAGNVGNGGDGGSGYGFYSNTGSSTLHISGITGNSEFYGNVNAANSIKNGTLSGGILGGGGAAGFSGSKGGAGGNGYGFYSVSLAPLQIDQISHSFFYGNVNISTVAGELSRFGGAMGGGGDGADNIGTTVGGAGGNGYGFYRSGSATVTITSIQASHFYGNVNNATIGTVNRYGGMIGGGGAGSYGIAPYTTDGTGGAGSNGYGFYMNTGSAVINIGGISGSTFYGNVDTSGSVLVTNGGALGGGGKGLDANGQGGKGSNGYGMDLISTDGIGMGNVTGNTFGANTGVNKTNNLGAQDGVNGIGSNWFIGGDNGVSPTQTENVEIASIIGNTFRASNFVSLVPPPSTPDRYLNFHGGIGINGTINVGGNAYSIGTISSLATYLKNNNIFSNTGSNNAVLRLNTAAAEIAP